MIKILELKSIDSELDSSSDNDIFRINQSFSSDYQSTSIESSSSPKIKLGCKDSFCQNKAINVLSKQEELLLDLIEKVEDPIVKAQYLSKLQNVLVREPKEDNPKSLNP